MTIYGTFHHYRGQIVTVNKQANLIPKGRFFSRAGNFRATFWTRKLHARKFPARFSIVCETHLYSNSTVKLVKCQDIVPNAIMFLDWQRIKIKCKTSPNKKFCSLRSQILTRENYLREKYIPRK